MHEKVLWILKSMQWKKLILKRKKIEVFNIRAVGIIRKCKTLLYLKRKIWK